MNYLLDTNIVIGFLNNDDKILRKIKNIKSLNISVITVGELLYGSLNSKNKDKNLLIYKKFFDCCNLFEVNKNTSQVYADIRYKLKLVGKPIPENDLWIASIAIENKLTIVTRDSHLLDIDFLNSILW